LHRQTDRHRYTCIQRHTHALTHEHTHTNTDEPVFTHAHKQTHALATYTHRHTHGQILCDLSAAVAGVVMVVKP